MELDVWVEFDEEQNYEGKMSDWAKDVLPGEFATRRSPFFPYGHDAFWKARSLASSGKYETDWKDNLTQYVIVPKSEVITLIKSLYSNMPHLNERLNELLAYVEKLPDDRLYKLVSQEF